MESNSYLFKTVGFNSKTGKCTLFLKNIPVSVPLEEIRRLCVRYGPIIHAQIVDSDPVYYYARLIYVFQEDAKKTEVKLDRTMPWIAISDDENFVQQPLRVWAGANLATDSNYLSHDQLVAQLNCISPFMWSNTIEMCNYFPNCFKQKPQNVREVSLEQQIEEDLKRALRMNGLPVPETVMVKPEWNLDDIDRVRDFVAANPTSYEQAMFEGDESDSADSTDSSEPSKSTNSKMKTDPQEDTLHLHLQKDFYSEQSSEVRSDYIYANLLMNEHLDLKSKTDDEIHRLNSLDVIQKQRSLISSLGVLEQKVPRVKNSILGFFPPMTTLPGASGTTGGQNDPHHTGSHPKAPNSSNDDTGPPRQTTRRPPPFSPCYFVRQTLHLRGLDGRTISSTAAAGCSCRHRYDGLGGLHTRWIESQSIFSTESLTSSDNSDRLQRSASISAPSSSDSVVVDLLERNGAKYLVDFKSQLPSVLKNFGSGNAGDLSSSTTSSTVSSAMPGSDNAVAGELWDPRLPEERLGLPDYTPLSRYEQELLELGAQVRSHPYAKSQQAGGISKSANGDNRGFAVPIDSVGSGSDLNGVVRNKLTPLDALRGFPLKRAVAESLQAAAAPLIVKMPRSAAVSTAGSSYFRTHQQVPSK